MNKLFYVLFVLSSLVILTNCNSDNPTEIVTIIGMPIDSFYVGGKFTISDNPGIENIAYWDGKSWHALGSGVTGKHVDVECMAFYNGELYVGGFIDSAGETPVKNIARWDGNNWYDVGGGINGRVTSLVVYKGALYAGGWFDYAGGSKADNIAKWNGNSWSAVGEGLSDEVYTLCIYKDELYAGGWFTTDYYLKRYFSANKIAKWDGIRWDSLGNGIKLKTTGGGGYVTNLAVFNNELYAAGNFDTCDSLSVSNIAKWNNEFWQSVDNLILSNNTGTSAVFDNELHLAGASDSNLGNVTPYYAIWNGTKLNLNKFALDGYPYCLYSTKNYLYIGGSFKTVNNKIVNGIYGWDGTTVINFGSGVSGYVSSILSK